MGWPGFKAVLRRVRKDQSFAAAIGFAGLRVRCCENNQIHIIVVMTDGRIGVQTFDTWAEVLKDAATADLLELAPLGGLHVGYHPHVRDYVFIDAVEAFETDAFRATKHGRRIVH